MDGTLDWSPVHVMLVYYVLNKKTSVHIFVLVLQFNNNLWKSDPTPSEMKIPWYLHFPFHLQINKANYSDENFSVVVNKSANEVVATYKKDETGMDLVIRLPESYPLKLVIVNCTRSLGISEAKQRKWEMSMMSFVQNQVLYSSRYFSSSSCFINIIWVFMLWVDL